MENGLWENSKEVIARLQRERIAAKETWKQSFWGSEDIYAVMYWKGYEFGFDFILSRTQEFETVLNDEQKGKESEDWEKMCRDGWQELMDRFADKFCEENIASGMFLAGAAQAYRRILDIEIDEGC